jgi:hypothetical protein
MRYFRGEEKGKNRQINAVSGFASSAEKSRRSSEVVELARRTEEKLPPREKPVLQSS